MLRPKLGWLQTKTPSRLILAPWTYNSTMRSPQHIITMSINTQPMTQKKHKFNIIKRQLGGAQHQGADHQGPWELVLNLEAGSDQPL